MIYFKEYLLIFVIWILVCYLKVDLMIKVIYIYKNFKYDIFS